MVHRKNRRGFVLVVVMFTLMVLTMMVAGYYAQTSDSLVSSKLVAGGQVAQSNAQFGLQWAIMDLRMGNINVAPMTGGCGPTIGDYDDMTNCIAPNNGTTGALCDSATCGVLSAANGYRSAYVFGTGNGNLLGGGLKYQYVVFHNISAPPGRYTIRSYGFFGGGLDSPNLINSILEAELDVASGSITVYTKPEGYEP